MKRYRLDLIPGKDNWYQSDTIITTGNDKHQIVLDFGSVYNATGPVMIQIVYWEDGEWKVINDYISSPYYSTVIDISVGGAPSISSVYVKVTGPSIGSIIIDSEREFTRIFENPMNQITDLMNVSSEAKSPLVIDLDGDGVETTTSGNGVHFDHDGNGFAEKSGWVGKDDGLLVRDINGNGQIDDGTELFGNNSVLSSGDKAANGFEALKDLDSNGDGVFNASDTAWNEVKVWKDANQNGYVDAGELLSLEQVSISGINVGYQNGDNVDENGNTHGQTGTYIKTDGTTGNVTDVWFDVNSTDTVDKSNVEIPEAIKSLPEVAGFGNVHSLQVAMALDVSGELKTLVEQFAAETDIAARDALLNNILYHWAGVQNEDPRGRDPTQIYGPVLDDCRKLEALEEFMGEDFLGTWCWGERDPNPHAQAAPYILQAFDELKNYLNLELLSQTHYKSLLEGISMNYNAESGNWDVNVSDAVAILQGYYSTDTAAGQKVLIEFAKLIKSYKDFSASVFEAFKAEGSLEGTALEEDLFRIEGLFNIGTAGDDVLNGNNGNDLLNGGAGNDRIYGAGGDDILNGGAGDDILVSGAGTDIYRFDVGFGNDSIDNMSDDASNTDSIEFGAGIEASRTTLERQGFDLIIRVSYADENQPAGTVRIFSYFNQQGTTNATVNSIKFADGTEWNYEYVRDNCNYTAGAGSNDIYLWNIGDGLDIITEADGYDKVIFGEGINASDVILRQVSDTDDLQLIINGNENQGIIIKNFFTSQGYKIEELCFNNGDRLYISDADLTLQQGNGDEIVRMKDNVKAVYGNDGNDTIYGSAGNDIISGGKGNDVIEGGTGDDTYVWNLGDGFDTVTDYNVWYDMDKNDKIKFGEGIAVSDVTFRHVDNDLIVNVNNDLTQGMVIKNYFESECWQVEYAEFADGTVIKINDGVTFRYTDEDEIGGATDGHDTIYGMGGNDTLYAGAGNDIISGGKGNDVIEGGTGDDTYVWNLGDGFDTVTDYNVWYDMDKNDKIKFGEGIAVSDVTFRHVGNDLIVNVNNDLTQGMVIKNYFESECYQVEYAEFADGTVIKINDGVTFRYTDEDEVGGATDGHDTIYGNDGNDTLYAGAGNDIIYGGKGNDIIEGGTGDDTYVWNLGDGFDTITDYNVWYYMDKNDKIKFGEGIAVSDVTFRHVDNDLIVNVNNDLTQGMVIKNYFESECYQVEYAEFADGTVINTSSLQLIQAMSAFSPQPSALTEAFANPSQNINEMYNLAADNNLANKAV